MAVKVGGGYANGYQLYNGIKALITSHGGWTVTLDTAPAADVYGSGTFTLEFTSSATIDGETLKVRIKQTTESSTTNSIEYGIVATPNGVATGTASTTSITVGRTYVKLGNNYIIIARYTNGTAPRASFIMVGNLVPSPINTSGLTGINKCLYGEVAGNIGTYNMTKYGTYNTSGVLTNNVSCNAIPGVVSWTKQTSVDGADVIGISTLGMSLSGANGYFGQLGQGIYISDDTTNGPYSLITSGGIDYFLINNVSGKTSPMIVKWINE